MDIKQRGGLPPRPTVQSSQAGVRKKKLSNLWKIIITIVVVLCLVGLAAYQVFGVGSAVDRSKYQAVFLTNGQVYFGKLSGWGGSQPTLTDVYYFQATGDGAETESGQPGGDNPSNTQALVKLGEEIHKPADKLILNRDSILFVENIEDDGQVVDAIKNNQDNKKD